ncbi:DUF4406 domain-containing protein [Eisenbergiella tayi]|uniref:DUF7768 domain-containing protein n=1 Tax=Eisenbergiella tayi TaxID=1432052 RepID=UPI00242C430B|nr:DUF4406 domain-containing protein [Eisenbergiella tayi]
MKPRKRRHRKGKRRKDGGNEGIEEERRLGISMGMELLALCDEVWVFGEATEGMAAEIAYATEQGKEIIFRETEGM